MNLYLLFNENQTYIFTGVPLNRIRRGINRSKKNIRHRTRL